MTAADKSLIYDGARDALFVRSDPMADDAEEVRGIDFNTFQGRSVTVEDLVSGMSHMGFQASAVGQATKIIESMVNIYWSIHFKI